jgi:acetyl esterase/lipase
VIVPLLAFAAMSGTPASPCPATPYQVESATHAYGEDTEYEALDLYVPRGVHSAPLAIYVHGGAWVSHDKSEYAQLGAAFARCGIAAAVVNYPLAPAMPARGQAEQLAAAVRWLIAHASNNGYDRKRVVLVGHSAGAQLALYMTVTGLVSHGTIARIVALGSVGINPSTDVTTLDVRYQSIYDPAFGEDRAAWTQFDLKPRWRGDEPPVLVIHGRDDVLAPEAISRQLYEQLKAAGDRVEYLQPAGRGHWDMIDQMTRPGDPTMTAIERFIVEDSHV